ncbi:MAG TPA: rod shape-determining protein MreD, partial [Anaerovoracaceae bacterium]|nr:rod shape-determining protein MreD [Anaerovoracaceae bacterium]
GITPNFLLCLTVMFSFLYSGNQGMVYGIIFGLFQDIGFSILIGPSAMIYFLIALAMGEIRHYIYRDSILNLSFVSAIGTVLYYTMSWLILMVFKGNYSFLYMLKNIPILIASHIVLVIIFYFIIGKRMVRYPEERYYRSPKMYDLY